MTDRVIELIDIFGAVFVLAFIVGIEIGKHRERRHWKQFRSRRP